MGVRPGPYPVLAVTICVMLAGCSEGTSFQRGPDREQVRRSIATGRFEEAEGLARRYLKRTERDRGADALATAEALDQLSEALSYRVDADLDEAVEHAERALGIKRSLLEAGDPGIATSLIRLGVVLDLRATINGAPKVEFRRARELLERALEIRSDALPASDWRVGEALARLGILHSDQGDYGVAGPLLEDAVAVLEGSLDATDPFLAFVRMMYGNLLWWTGDLEDAKVLFEQALAGRRASYGVDHPKVAGTLNNLAMLNQRLGDLESARDQMEAALEIRRRRHGAGDQLVAIFSFNLAAVLDRLGDHDAADALLAASLDGMIETLGPDHPTVAYQLDARAARCTEDGRHDCAVAAYERALALRTRVYGDVHPDVSDSMVGLATALAATGENLRALELALRAEEIGREHQVLTSQVLAERQALEYARTRSSGLGLALRLAVGGLDGAATARVWDAVTMSRGLVLEEMAERRRTQNARRDARLSRLWQELADSRERVAEIAVQGPDPDRPAEFRSRLEAARRAKERAERLVGRESAAFRAAQERKRATLADAARGLPPRSALLSYVVYDGGGGASGDRVYAGLLLGTPDAEAVALPIGPADAIDTLVDRYRFELSNQAAPDADERFRSAATELRKRIWDPVASLLPEDTRNLFVVPDGSLNLVSLVTLPSGNGRYLVETGPALHYLSAERDLVAGRDVSVQGNGLLVLGDPSFSEPDDTGSSEADAAAALAVEAVECSSLGAVQFPELPATLREIDEIAGMWTDMRSRAVTKLSRSAASEAAFKREAPGKRVLHLATHGFFIDSDCLLETASQLRRGLGDVKPVGHGKTSSDPNDNPLLLSGLALAGANAAEPGRDDGILTAEEIASLDLSGVEWAVLSACDTGIGRVRAGEGVLGLRRAFQVSGVATLIMSLWPVEDESAREWMRELYRARLNGETSIRAVHQATGRILAARRLDGRSVHPFHWGAFVAAGDWR